ncbi:MBL fold metallo-hydrolase [Janibacter alkaliphilus]|uniref:Glyoxylase-like metal-dependent hydrolase (Beta-lactamase superfamily II) n=1 Tax=Janibacter alkaliphilus TaxID=1069963 RepID=A0A852X3D6_9MICO|nr:MBL fold metallo-hydrolase [Janibacter alkaliphilus]NYG36948.1 glyoxylase-like metal-dependent hydrolase (beta-lactamase superfamily II) [Janibacter alkaliphilus]
MTARIEHLTTSGTFELDGGSWEVDNNVWLVGDDEEVVVIDAGHEAAPILEQVGERRVVAVVCTHAHNDHVNAAAEVADASVAPILLHPAEAPLWEMTYPDRQPDGELTDGQTITVAGTELEVRHTPGHSPGACCLYAPELGVLFSGDTLFNGGPGATGRSYSDFPTIVASITDRLLGLPPETQVRTGHGDSTTIGDEAPHRQEWLDRGH